MRTAVQITETLHLLDLLCGFTAGLSYPITSGFCNNPPIAVEWSSREADDCEIKTHTFPTIQSVPWRRKWPKPVSRTSPQICVDVLVLSRYDSVLAIASTGMCAGVRDMTSAEACGTQWAYSATRMAAFWEQLQKVLAANAPIIELSDDTKQVLFQMLKSTKSGADDIIDMRELGECLKTLGFSPSREDIEFLKKHFDDNQDGELSIAELLENLDVLNYHFYYGKALMNAFRSIDRDGDGVIRFPEMLRVLMTNRTHPFPQKEARDLLTRLAHEFDSNFDGKFSYSEFVKIYMSDVLPFKQELGSGAMIELDDVDEEQPGDDGKPAAAKDASGRSAKKNWGVLKDKLRSTSLTTSGASQIKTVSSSSNLLHPDAARKKRKDSEADDSGVMLYARRWRRKSWAP